MKEKYYGFSFIPTIPEYANDKEILKWWNEDCDNLIKKEINEKYLMWSQNIVKKIIRLVSENVVECWRESDPNCKQWAWYDVLLYFIVARAYILGYFQNLPMPQNRVCPICKKNFGKVMSILL